MDIFIRIFIEIPLPVLHISGKKKSVEETKRMCAQILY